MYGQIRFDAPRPAPELLKRFEGVWAAVCCDAMGRNGVMGREIRPIYDGIRIVGPALTVLAFPADNITTHKALQLVRPGDVIVIDDGGAHDVAAFGHNMSLNARKKGAVGLVTNGSIRDLALLRRDRFPIFCSGITPRSPQKSTPGAVNVPIHVAGVVVKPGDIVVADDDGVAVVPLEIAEDIAQKVGKRMEMEEQQAEDIKNGKLPLEILFGATWVDDILKGKVVEIGKPPSEAVGAGR